MAYTYLNSVLKQGTGSGTGNSAQTDMTGADLIIIVQCINLVASGNGPGDNLGNTYTLAISQQRSGAPGLTTNIWYCHAPTVSSTMQFFSNHSAFDAIAVAGYSGSPSTPLDTTNSDSSTFASSLNTGSVTITAGELVVFGIGDAWGPTITATPGTVRQQAPIASGNSFAVGIGDIIGGSAGAQSSTWTTTGFANDVEVVIASFKASGGGGGGKLFTPSNMDGIGSGGPFFSDRLAA